VAVTGHGLPMRGDALAGGLEALARDFDHVARPAYGRYALMPARADASGTTFVPPPVPDATPWALLGTAALAGLLVATVRRDGGRDGARDRGHDAPRRVRHSRD
jgi:hypothetical protein